MGKSSHFSGRLSFVSICDTMQMDLFGPEKVKHPNRFFGTLIAGGETDEHAEAVERSH